MSFIILSGDHKTLKYRLSFESTTFIMMAFALFFIEFQPGPSIHHLEKGLIFYMNHLHMKNHLSFNFKDGNEI